MIINSLCDYYDLLENDKSVNISPYGKEMIDASYNAVLSEEGDLISINSLTEFNDKKPQGFMMPKSMKISAIAASPVCDNFAYVFGISGKKGNKEIEEEKFQTAKELHIKMFENATSKESVAIKKFFEKWDINQAWENEYILKYYSKTGNAFSGNTVFSLSGADKYLHQSDEIVDIWLRYNKDKHENSDEYRSQCSVTGEYDLPIARIHPKFSGIKGASTMGASLVSFNKDADSSYNLSQSYNAAVSEMATFKYSTALEYMLSNMRQKMFIGDDTAVFWASSPQQEYTAIFREMFNVSDDDDEDVDEDEDEKITVDRKIEEIVKSVLKDGMQGIANDPKFDLNTKFYVLGLAPNAGRISVRYFYVSSFKVFCEKIKQHYDDISIYGGQKGKKNIKIGGLIYATISSKSKDKKVNPLLGGAVTRAILTGDMYPQILFNQTLIRVKTESNVPLTQARAAIIKGYLLRKSRILNKKEGIDVYLNEQSTNAAYVLGRVFALLEKIQKDALGDINATIKDKYFATACSNPSLVFPNLLKLAQHHLAKINNNSESKKAGNYLNKKIGDCLSLLEGESFPKVLNMENQGRFILGYYQQNQKNYEKREINKEEKQDDGKQII